MTLTEATVVIADDNPEVLEIYSIWLSRSGCNVLRAANGVEALDLISHEQVHVLLSDINMPIMDGVSLIRTLYDRGIVVPSVLLVSGLNEVSAREAYSLGVEAMFSKPVPRQDLLQALERAVKDRSELWRSPLPYSPEIAIEMKFPSFREAVLSNSFGLGRGGFCVRFRSLSPEINVSFHLSFAQEQLQLKGQGCVRWNDAENECVGIEFVYLHPDSHAWATTSVYGPVHQRFIPTC